MSKVYSLKKVQQLNVSLAEAWDFFSSPANLAEITPKHLGFKIISLHHGPVMYAGQVIEYTVKPFLEIPLYWMTEITHVEHQKYFVDDQRYGPYSMWHHQHHFRENDGGVEMTDIIHYKLPLWFLGDILNTLFVRNQLEKIFDHRFKVAEELFNSPGRGPGRGAS
jgi:ligand-binding SRPBCC domain-containing protein